MTLLARRLSVSWESISGIIMAAFLSVGAFLFRCADMPFLMWSLIAGAVAAIAVSLIPDPPESSSMH